MSSKDTACKPCDNVAEIGKEQEEKKVQFQGLYCFNSFSPQNNPVKEESLTFMVQHHGEKKDVESLSALTNCATLKINLREVASKVKQEFLSHKLCELAYAATSNTLYGFQMNRCLIGDHLGFTLQTLAFREVQGFQLGNTITCLSLSVCRTPLPQSQPILQVLTKWLLSLSPCTLLQGLTGVPSLLTIQKSPWHRLMKIKRSVVVKIYSFFF